MGMSCSRRVKVGYNGIESTLIYEELRNAVAEYHSIAQHTNGEHQNSAIEWFKPFLVFSQS